MAFLTPQRARLLAVAIVVVGLGAAVTAAKVGGNPQGVLGQTASPDVIAVADARPAPELTGITGYADGQPISLAGQRGKVVLLDFWTYTCINCLRTFPELHALQDTYGASGLQVIGVHSPEFDFEKDHDNVAKAVKDLGVTWPVAEDPGMATWNAYGVQYWPTQVLIDREGRVRFGTIGEGGAAKTEAAIRTLLADGGTAPAVGASLAPEDPTVGQSITPETYLAARNPEQKGNATIVAIDGKPHVRADAPQPRDVVRLTGSFTSDNEALRPLAGARLEQKVRAKNVFLTAQGPSDGSATIVDVTLDGQPVPADQRGTDVRLVGGRTVLTLQGSRLFDLLTAPQTRLGTLALTFRTPGSSLFTFTYGG